jgi:hypothetical protein
LPATLDVDGRRAPDAVFFAVLEYYEKPSHGRIVAVGSRKTTADARKHFLLEGIARAYDLVVADASGAAVSVTVA